MLIRTFLIAGTLLTASTFAYGAAQTVDVALQMVAVHNGAEGNGLKFGGCYAKLPENTVTLNGCDDNFVTFSCDGVGSYSKSAGAQMYSTAQLAFVMGKNAKIYVTDARIANGVCEALNIRVLN